MRFATLTEIVTLLYAPNISATERIAGAELYDALGTDQREEVDLRGREEYGHDRIAA